MRKITTALLFAAASTSTLAQSMEANFTGPLVTPNAAALPPGIVVIEPYLIYNESHASYDTHGSRHSEHPGAHQWLQVVPITIGVAPRFNVELVAGAAHNVSGKSHSDGVQPGDTSVLLQYMLLAPRTDGTGPAISATYSHIFPTGKYQRLGDNPLNATGSGASTDRLALLGQQLFWLSNGHPLRLRGQLAWGPTLSRVNLHDVSSYGTPGGFRGWAKPGMSWGSSVSAEYGLDGHWVLAMDITWDHQRGTTLRGSPCRPDELFTDQRTPSHWVYSAAPAIEYNFNDSVGLIVGTQVSFAGHRSSAFWAPQAALNVAF